MKKRDKYIKKYISFDNIAKDIFDESLSGKCIEKSEDTINFLNDNYRRGKLIERFTNSSQMEQLLTALRENKDDNLNLLRQKLQNQRARRKSKQRKIVFLTSGVAASLIFLIFYISTVSLRKDSTEQPTTAISAQSHFITPTLILGSGATVNLNAEIGIKENENNIAKIEKNRLKYSKSCLTKEIASYNKLIVPVGFTYNLELSDGTRIVVNAGGEIKYPIVFSGDKREVELIGEAYFDVAKSDIPFIVNVGKSAVQVYGTQFNINYSTSLDFIETVLIEGKIGFKQDGEKETILKPNERLIYVNSTATVESVNGKDMIAWKDGKFNFVNQSVERVLDDIKNWYGVKFYASASMKMKKISMFCNKDASLADVMKFMEEILNVEIIKKEGEAYEITTTK